VVLVSSAFCFVLSQGFVRAAEADGDILGEIREALAGRDLNAAKAKLAEAANAGDDAFAQERDRLQSLHQCLEEFWKAVDDSAKSLESTEELVIGENRVSVVEYQPGLLVLRVNGQNRRYTVKTVPAVVVLTLAKRVLKPDSPENKVLFGAFSLMDGRGDREQAAKYWDEAQKAGVSVADLLPELRVAPVEPVATLPVEIPPLTAFMRKVLAPGNWSLRRLDGERIVRSPLKEVAEQTTLGHLQLSLPTDGGPSQLVYTRKPTGNFVCRVILQNIEPGQVFGLFAADALDDGYQVPLPKGAAMIEFSRQSGAFQCRINQKDVPVASHGEVTANMVGTLGFTCPAGAKCTVAWFELQGR
jgi:hypothetical protein